MRLSYKKSLSQQRLLSFSILVKKKKLSPRLLLHHGSGKDVCSCATSGTPPTDSRVMPRCSHCRKSSSYLEVVLQHMGTYPATSMRGTPEEIDRLVRRCSIPPRYSTYPEESIPSELETSGLQDDKQCEGCRESMPGSTVRSRK